MSLLKRQKRASGTHQGHQSDKTKWNPTVATPHGESSLLVSSSPFLYSRPLSSESSSRATRFLSFLSLHPSFLSPSLSFYCIPSRYFISVPTLSQCERAKGAEEARVRPEWAREGMGLKPFKRKGGKREHHPSCNFNVVVSKAPLTFFCDGM